MNKFADTKHRLIKAPQINQIKPKTVEDVVVFSNEGDSVIIKTDRVLFEYEPFSGLILSFDKLPKNNTMRIFSNRQQGNDITHQSFTIHDITNDDFYEASQFRITESDTMITIKIVMDDGTYYTMIICQLSHGLLSCQYSYREL